MSVRVGKIIGIPITIDVSWFVIFALIVYSLAVGYFPVVNPKLGSLLSWVGGITAALLLFASVLLHELMHSYVAIRNGMHVGGITLFIFGGVSRLTDEPPTPGIEFKMAIAGPVTSLVLSGIFWAAWRYGGVPLLGNLGYEVVGYLALINFVLGIFNLIPGFPLDGGRVLRSIIWGAVGNLDRATRAASVIGQGFGYLFIAGGFWMMLGGRNLLSGLWLVFIGWFLNNAAQQSYQQMQLRNVLSGVRVGQVMTTDYPHIDPDLSIYDFVHEYLLRYDYSAFPVSVDGQLVGIMTVQEVRDIPREKWHDTTVGSVAQPPEGEITIDEDDDAFDALSHMAQENSSRLIVMNDGQLKGMVTQESIISLVRTKMRLGI